MTRLQFSVLLAALGVLATACGDDPESECFGASANCGFDSSAGPIMAAPDSGALLPDASAATLPDASAATDAGAIGPRPDAGLPGMGGIPGGIFGGLFDSGRPPGGSLPDASVIPDAGSDAGSDGGSMLPPVSGGTAPKIPEIKGECPVFKNGTIMVAGHRGVQLSVGDAGKNGPLYFFWHGTGGSASQVSMVPAAIRNEVIAMGGIIASFNGGSSSQAAGDCSGTAAHNIADFDAADQIVACAVKNHGIDPRRIYTTGCSAGGLQSGCMAQLRSSYVAAAAPNSGGIVFPQRWQDAGKPAIFSMHGGPSDWVIVTFSETSATLNMSAKQHGSFVVNCDHGGGHCGAPAALYNASWKFMKDHPYGVESPWKGGIPSGIPDYCKIF